MKIRLSRFCLRLGLVFCCQLSGALAIVAANAPAQTLNSFGTPPIAATEKKQKNQHPIEKDEPKPTTFIPVGPLGFASPAPFYLGDRFAMVSLSFLDEDNLLFTFRVPGLIAREATTPGQSPAAERHIRALTLSVPTGKVTAESLWVLHDYGRYLWAVKGQKFLLRDRNILQIGDSTLRLQPFLRFPGPIDFIEFDPGQNLMVTNTTEIPAPEVNEDSKIGATSNPAAQPSTAAASVSFNGHLDMDHLDRQKAQPEPQNLVRIFSMDTRKVMLFSRVNGAVHIPIDGEGYYEALRGSGSKWMISFNYLQGGSAPLGWVDSACDPMLDALYPGIVMASSCTAGGARQITALSRDHDWDKDKDKNKDHSRLWELTLPPTSVWPQLTTSADGLRMARETLEVSHPIGPYSTLDNADIRGQIIQVYDLATGKVQLTVPAAPVLDGGGNFALSPSGRRLAVLNSGAIQVFDLPPAPPMPTAQSPAPVPGKP